MAESKLKEKMNKKSEDVTVTYTKLGRRHWEAPEGGHSDEEGKKKSKPKLEYPPAEERTFLKPREEEVDLEGGVGKLQVITSQTPKEDQGGYYCKACDVLIKDSQAYLDHINGKKHNRMLGMNMTVERVGVQSVMDKFKSLKKKKEQKPVRTFEEYEAKLEREQKDEAAKKKAKRDRKKMKRRGGDLPPDDEQELNNEGDAELQAAGLPISFSSKKRWFCA